MRQRFFVECRAADVHSEHCFEGMTPFSDNMLDRAAGLPTQRLHPLDGEANQSVVERADNLGNGAFNRSR